MWTVELPTYLTFGIRKPKKIPLNLNQYRNAPFHLLSDMKVSFAEIVAPRIAHIPPMDRVRLSYWLFTPSARELDINNVISVVDKFFCDVFVKEGKLPDDNYKHLLGTASAFGGIDRSNPRVEVVVEPLE